MLKRIMLVLVMLIVTSATAMADIDGWELITEWKNDYNITTYEYRLRTPGGWLVKMVGYHGSEAPSVALVYVPDPNHIWKLEK